MIDSKLSWKQHVTFIKSKISKSIGILCRAKKVLRTDSLVTLYNSFVYPMFSYCLEIWGRSYKVNIESLFRMQKKIVRIVTFSNRKEHTSPLFKKLNILPLSKLYEYRMLMFLFKFEKKCVPSIINNLFVRHSDVHMYQTRNARSLQIPRFTLDVFRHSFIYNAITLYNKAVHKLDFSLNAFTFKFQVKRYLNDNKCV